MRRITSLSILCLGTVLLTGCGQKLVNQTQPTPPAPAQQNQTLPQADQQTVLLSEDSKTKQPPTSSLEPVALKTEQPPSSPPALETQGWATYSNIKFGLEFQYPKEFIANKLGGGADYEEWELKKGDNFLHIKLTNWKTYIIEEGTPGTFYEEIARGNWEYFISNFSKIKTGNCNDDEKKHSSTLANPEECKIFKKDNYVIIDTNEDGHAHELFAYNKNIGISFDFAKNINETTINKIIDSIKFTK